MSGETEEHVSGWTVDTLHQHLIRRLDAVDRLLNQRMDDADKAIAAALMSAEKAVTKAENASEKRFEGVNEFRGALADQQKDLLRRSEYNAAHDALIGRVVIVSDRLAALELRLTSRIDQGEGAGRGSATARTEQRLDTAQAVQVLALLIVAAGTIFAIIHG